MKAKLTLKKFFGRVVIRLGYTLVILSLMSVAFPQAFVSDVWATSPPTVDGKVDDVYLTDGDVVYFGNATYPDLIHTMYILDDANIDADYIYVAYVLSPDFVDNTWGDNACGYKQGAGKGHGLEDLEESDLQQFRILKDCSGTTSEAWNFYLGLIQSGQPTASGYDHTGVNDPDAIDKCGGACTTPTDWDSATSTEYNLNGTGYCSGGSCSCNGTDLLSDSPPISCTDNSPDYSTVPDGCNLWEFEIVYEFRFARSELGTGCTLHQVEPLHIHASPSKTGDHDIPVYKLGSIGDYVWNDSGPDIGKQDAYDDPGLNDVEMELWLDDGDGVFELDQDTKQATMLTQNDGSGNPGWYLFTKLFAGTYFVRIAPDEFDLGGTLYYYNPTEPNKTDVDEALDSDGDNPTCPYDPVTDTGTCGQALFEDNILAKVTLAAGAQDLTIDFGVVSGTPPTAVTLSSFAAKSGVDGSASPLWLGLAGFAVLAAGSLFWAKRRAS